MTLKHLDQKKKLETATGALALAALSESKARDNKNISSEDAAARSSMGWPEVDTEETPVHVGDVNHPPQQVIVVPPATPTPSKGLNSIAAFGLGVLGPVGILAGQYLMTDDPKPEPVQKIINVANDPGETIRLGLKRLSDLDVD